MARDNLLKSFREVIEKQLEAKDPISTYNTYQTLLDKGFDEDRVMQKLMFYLEDMIYETLSGNEYHEEDWNEKMKELAEEEVIDNYISNYHFHKISSKCRKEFGYIAIGGEDAYEDGLLAIESNLYTLHKKYQLLGKDILKVVELAIAMMYAYYHDDSYNYENIASEDIIYLAKLIEFNLNAYENKELRDDFLSTHDVDLNDPEIRKSVFTMAIRCLVKVKESIEYWMKQYGSNGYIDFISRIFEAE